MNFQLGRQSIIDGTKLVKAHKRHILLDAQGLLLQVTVGAEERERKSLYNHSFANCLICPLFLRIVVLSILFVIALLLRYRDDI